MPASEICSSQCIIAVGNMFWFCVPGGWQKDVLLLEVFPPRNWDCPAWSYRQGDARVRAEKAAQDLILQHLLSPEVGSYCSMPCLSCGCGQEHLAIFAKSGLLGSNRGKELVHHAMVSLGPL